MGFRSGAYCKIWDVSSLSDRVAKLRLSIDRKNKEGAYEQEFGDYVLFVGSACASQAMRLQKGDRIRLGDVDVTNKYDKAARRTYYDFKVFSFEMADGKPGFSGSANAKKVDELEPEPPDEDVNAPDLPF